MKPKHLVVIVGILLAAGGLWFGHAAWRAHRQLVNQQQQQPGPKR